MAEEKTEATKAEAPKEKKYDGGPIPRPPKSAVAKEEPSS